MRKLWVLLMLCASVQAYARTICPYNGTQIAIRNAEYVKDVEHLRNKKDELNADYSCRSPFQLAVLRGNYSVLYQLLTFGLDANKPVPMEGFNPDGDYPDKIPPILFAALFAHNGETIQVMLDAGIDPKVKDANGNDFFWYLDQNPVLRHSYMSEGGYAYLVPGGYPEDEIDKEAASVESAEKGVVVDEKTFNEAAAKAEVKAKDSASEPVPEEPLPEVPIDDEMPLPTELTVDPADAMGE